ncbi:hypothetical protein KAX06_03835 [candidate division WOR-3 bacterium]|nr:hypothetical protein [candidate division WOR-3 bacterium]
MNKIREAMDRLAINKGVKPQPIPILKDRKHVLYLIEGFHGAAPVHFTIQNLGSNARAGIMSRLAMLEFDLFTTEEINLKLSESWMLWNQINPLDTQARLILENPTVIWVPVQPQIPEGIVASFSSAEHLLSFFAIHSKFDFMSVPSFPRSNRIYKSATGVVLSSEGITPIPPPPSASSPSTVQAVGFDLSGFLDASEVIEAYWRAISWRRQAKVIPTLIDKFVYLWVSMESTFPRKKEWHKSKRIRDNVCMLWGKFPTDIMNNLDSKYKTDIIAQETKIDELGALIVRTYQQFRSNILHYGELDAEINPALTTDIITAIEAFRDVNLRCCWLLEYSIKEKGIDDLRAVWEPLNVLEFVCTSADKNPEFLRHVPFDDPNLRLSTNLLSFI